MKRVLIPTVMMAVLIAGCGKKEEKAVALEQHPIQVSVAAAATGAFTRTLEYTGTVLPWKQAGIIPDVSGRVAHIYVREGERVQKGQLLAELDTTTLKLQEKQAAAAAAVAQAALKDARLNARRMHKLYEGKAISSLQLEKADLALESASTQKQSADATLNLVRHNLESARMAAPFSGIITARHLDEGDMINPQMGAGPGVLTLMDLSRVKVRVDVASEDIEKVSTGQQCTVRVSNLADRKFSGKVYSKTLAADPASKTFQAEIQVINKDMSIKAGVFADVSIQVSREEGVLMLPISALLGDDRVVVYDNGRARVTRVRVGQRNARHFEVLGGVAEGDRVVVEGNYDLKDGSLISIQGDKP